ncbi:MAG: NAD(P)/FAD-dependent oxidoreductase [Proteobacteria bacterium]|nr:NAD(P)/FAD-dependent oxidoreductase [Pseudomonadota bacterium]
MPESVESIVVGAGVVGLAVAGALARSGKEVLVLESGDDLGSGVSSRSSEVVHAGLYYPRGSAKADLCVRGRRLLYAFCREHRVPFKEIGKIIVATAADEVPRLHDLHARGAANGVTGIQFLKRDDIAAMEPALQGLAGLFLPMTGIVDSHALMAALRADAEKQKVTIALRTPFRSARAAGHAFIVEAGLGKQAIEVHGRNLVNAAGLNAQSVAARITRMQPTLIPKRHLSRGCYFSFSGNAPFRHLVYPLPAEGGLGIHYCLDMAGGVRFGPDHEWVSDIDYTVDPGRAEAFTTEIRKYWPRLPDNALQPAYAGIRPRIFGPGQEPADFMIQTHEQHGITRLVNLFGIESPGLTAALALADDVARSLR